MAMRVILGIGVAGVLIATSAWGQQLYIYPQRGQSFDQQAVDKPVTLADVAPAVRCLALATSNVTDPQGHALSEETIFEICTSLWCEPNLLYVLNFYAARRVDVRKALIGHSAAGDSPNTSEPTGAPPNGRDTHPAPAVEPVTPPVVTP